MRQALESKLQRVRVRCGLNVVLRQMAVVLAVAGVVAAAAVLAERVFSFPLVNAWTLGGLAGAIALLVAGLSLLRTPRRMQVAVLVDEQLAFRERFSTALALADSDDPFARAAAAEAHRAAERLNVRGRFPVRPTGHWLAAAATWLAAAGVFAFVPYMDVLGYVARKQAGQRKADELKLAQVEVRQAASKVEAAVQQVRDKQLVGDLPDLGELTKGVRPADVRREAIRKLGELAEAIENKLEESEQVRAGKVMNRLLKGLRNTPGALDNDLNRALANGQFGAAAKMLRDKLDQLNKDQLSEEDRQKLADQVKNLADQLNDLADPQKQAEDTLEREGMDSETAKKLAGLSQDDLREALKKRGMSDEEIDDLLDKMKSSQRACQNCKGLAEALAKCRGQMGELLPDGLVGLVEKLDAMEGADLDAESLAEAMKEIDRAIALLGDGEADGELDPNGAGIWIPSDANSVGAGPGGGRARAWGNRPTAEPEDTGTKGLGVKNKPSKDNEIVASWLFKGPQAKGTSKRKLAGVIEAERDAAAEAITDKKIPRKYEKAVKKYFGGLEKAAGADANQP